MLKTQKYYIIIFLLLSIATGCTIVDSSSILVGQKRAPIEPSEVKIYSTAPENFEEVAMISVKAGHDFKSEQSLMDSAIQRLKEEAAKVGANGVLLQEVRNRSNPNVISSFGTATAYRDGSSVTATDNSLSISRGDSYNRISGMAIYTYQKNVTGPN